MKIALLFLSLLFSIGTFAQKKETTKKPKTEKIKSVKTQDTAQGSVMPDNNGSGLVADPAQNPKKLDVPVENGNPNNSRTPATLPNTPGAPSSANQKP